MNWIVTRERGWLKDVGLLGGNENMVRIFTGRQAGEIGINIERGNLNIYSIPETYKCWVVGICVNVSI